MKKIVIILLFVVNLAVGQSVVISPNSLSRTAGISNDISILKYSDDYPTILGIRSGGTAASPTNSTNTMRLLAINAAGKETGNTYIQSNINFFTTENWSNTNRGTKITFGTTANGTATLSEKMVINHDGKVGIGITMPEEQLHVVGNIRLSNLAGTGNRQVYADANGTLTTTAQINTMTMIVTPQQFVRRYNSGTGTLSSSGAYLQAGMVGTGATDQLVTSFTLPDGAALVSATFYFNDNDANNNLKFLIGKSSVTNAGLINDATIFQNTTNSFPYTISSVSSATLNWSSDSNTYFTIIVEAVGLTQSSAGVWNYTGGNSNLMAIKGVKITYTL